MAKNLKVGGLLLVTASLLWAANVIAAPNQGVQWDDKASQELGEALHHMHEVWNQGDIESLKKYIIGDDVLVTFEMDPATHEPIQITSKAGLMTFVDNIVQNIEDEDAESILGHPGLQCRATENFGICTEQCTVTVKLPDGVEEHHKLWSTSTAIKDADGWKLIQWHMSSGGPVKVFKDGQLVAQN